jgi:hypothetical protein
MYDGLATVSDKFAFLAHAKLLKSWDALESNMMMIGCPKGMKVPVSTSPPSRISSTVVWLTRPVLGIGALTWPPCCITIDVGTLGALPFLGSRHCQAKCSTRPQLKHGAFTIVVLYEGERGDIGS